MPRLLHHGETVGQGIDRGSEEVARRRERHRAVNIFAVPVGADGCGYYRSFLPLTEVGRHGHNVSLPPRGMTWLPEPELQAEDIDVLAGQLISGPRGMALWEGWAGHAKLIYDIDDD